MRIYVDGEPLNNHDLRRLAGMVRAARNESPDSRATARLVAKLERAKAENQRARKAKHEACEAVRMGRPRTLDESHKVTAYVGRVTKEWLAAKPAPESQTVREIIEAAMDAEKGEGK